MIDITKLKVGDCIESVFIDKHFPNKIDKFKIVEVGINDIWADHLHINDEFIRLTLKYRISKFSIWLKDYYFINQNEFDKTVNVFNMAKETIWSETIASSSAVRKEGGLT